MAPITKMHSFMVTCVNDAAQAAAVEALENGQDDPLEFREAYRHRRDLMVSRMRKMGFEMATPQGAFTFLLRSRPPLVAMTLPLLSA